MTNQGAPFPKRQPRTLAEVAEKRGRTCMCRCAGRGTVKFTFVKTNKQFGSFGIFIDSSDHQEVLMETKENG